MKIYDVIDNISRKIKEENCKSLFKEIGYITKVSDGIAIIIGLENVELNEIIEFQDKTRGIVFSIEENNIRAVILGKDKNIKAGEKVRRTYDNFKIGVGKELLGRVINCFGEPIDNKGIIKTNVNKNVDAEAPSITKRDNVKEPLQTGIKIIDSLIPIGRGQRELIIGDRQTGKTSITIDAIINQKKINDKIKNHKNKVYCIYVAIGQKNSSVAKIIKKLEEMDSLKYSIIVVASAADPVPLQFYAPYIGCSIAEYFRDNEMHSLIIYDDLSKHAIAYRQMSLLLRRPPGREAYPGDIFYIHSKLLERSAKLSKNFGGGSLTALPIIETQNGDVSSYIATNIISITDGQIFLESELFRKGVKPAINIGLSVSRIGSAAQTKIIKNISSSLKLELAQYREMESFTQFGSDLDKDTKNLLDHGRKLTIMLNQKACSPLSLEDQFLYLFIATNGYLKNIEDSKIENFIKDLVEKIKEDQNLLIEELKNEEISGSNIKDINIKLKKYLNENIKINKK